MCNMHIEDNRKSIHACGIADSAPDQIHGDGFSLEKLLTVQGL